MSCKNLVKRFTDLLFRAMPFYKILLYKKLVLGQPAKWLRNFQYSIHGGQETYNFVFRFLFTILKKQELILKKVSMYRKNSELTTTTFFSDFHLVAKSVVYQSKTDCCSIFQNKC